MRYGVEENPHWIHEIHTKYLLPVNIWVKIVEDRMAALAQLHPNEEDAELLHAAVFLQQVGAQNYYAGLVHFFSNNIFPNKLMGWTKKTY